MEVPLCPSGMAWCATTSNIQLNPGMRSVLVGGLVTRNPGSNAAH